MFSSPTIIDVQSICFRNKEISVEDDTKKYNSNVLHLLEIIDSARYYCDMSSDSSIEEVDITPIDTTNDKTFSSNICDVNVIRKFYAPLLLSTN